MVVCHNLLSWVNVVTVARLILIFTDTSKLNYNDDGYEEKNQSQ